MLKPEECYRRIKPAPHIRHVLPILDRITWKDSGNVCAIVSAPEVPLQRQFVMLLGKLGLGGVNKRMFLRKLPPGMGIAPHVDDWIPAEENWRRFHVPLITHPDILMRWPDDGQEVHLEAGWLWEVRVDRTHEVVHNADIDRIHIQIDQANATV